jgi:hypothetical protein
VFRKTQTGGGFIPPSTFLNKSAEQQQTQLTMSGTNYLTTAYKHLVSRCYDKSNPDFARYGGRGIRVYEDWLDTTGGGKGHPPTLGCLRFQVWVLENLGERPLNQTLDRIESDGNYEPGNLRWATPAIQSSNRGTYLVTPKHPSPTGFRWVYLTGNRFTGQFSQRERTIRCGTFPTPEQVYQAVLAKREEMGLPLPLTGDAEG